MFDLTTSTTGTSSTTANTSTIPREFDYDFTNGQIVLENGSPKIVEGVYAIKIWIYKVLSVQRGKYETYSFNYGQDYEDLISGGLTLDAVKSEARKITENALYQNTDILKLYNFDFSITNDKITVSFSADTSYGTITMEVNV